MITFNLSQNYQPPKDIQIDNIKICAEKDAIESGYKISSE